MTLPPEWDRPTSPYHRGERELHARLQRSERQEWIGRRMCRSWMPDPHREFFRQLPFLVVGSVDGAGRPWASMLFGRPGFAASPAPSRLEIHARPLPGDPLRAHLTEGAPVGLLGIEPATRRRNRINGLVSRLAPSRAGDVPGAFAPDGGFALEVAQCFGNCPRYIQTRATDWLREPGGAIDIAAEPLLSLDAAAARLIAGADTLFVASHNPDDDPRDTGGVDASHRGGRPGFVKVEGDVLTVPDYSGNFAFNTLGNLVVNPRAGLLFVDFDSGDLLMLTGRAEVLWDKADAVAAFRGAERAWRFTLDHGLRLRGASPLRWRFGAYSPDSLATGDWGDAARCAADGAPDDG